MGGVVVALVLAAVTFTVWEPIQVLPRRGLAPGYSLVDQDGRRFTSEDARGAVTLYSFAPLDCGERCRGIDATMAEVGRRVAAEVDLGAVEFRLVTVALSPVPDDGERGALSAAATAAGADGETWRWVGGDEAEIRTLVGSGFHRWYDGAAGSTDFDPGYVLVDGNGVIRGDYRYRTLAADSDKLVTHMGVLADEIRNADGVASVAYEAAHLFLCYP